MLNNRRRNDRRRPGHCKVSIRGKDAHTKTRDQEAANRRPLISDNRKVAHSNIARLLPKNVPECAVPWIRAREIFAATRWGPRRRFARDYVDARWGLGEWLIIGVLVLALSFVPTPTMQMASTIGMLAFVFLVIFEGFGSVTR